MIAILETILWLVGIGLAVWAGFRFRLYLQDRHIEDGTLPGQRRI